MIRFTAIVEVPEDRRVMIALPPEVPVGPWAVEVEAYTPGDLISFFDSPSLEGLPEAYEPRIRFPFRVLTVDDRR